MRGGVWRQRGTKSGRRKNEVQFSPPLSTLRDSDFKDYKNFTWFSRIIAVYFLHRETKT